MSLADKEKQARRARRKRREEARRTGTYVPRGQRKKKEKRFLAKRASEQIVRERPDPEEIARREERRRKDEPRRLKRKFHRGQPVLIKARIDSHIVEQDGVPRYYVSPIESLQDEPTIGFYIFETQLAPWPKRRKK